MLKIPRTVSNNLRQVLLFCQISSQVSGRFREAQHTSEVIVSGSKVFIIKSIVKSPSQASSHFREEQVKESSVNSWINERLRSDLHRRFLTVEIKTPDQRKKNWQSSQCLYLRRCSALLICAVCMCSVWEVRWGNTKDLSWYQLLSFLFRSLSNSLFFLFPNRKSLSSYWTAVNVIKPEQNESKSGVRLHFVSSASVCSLQTINAVRHLLDAGWHYI